MRSAILAAVWGVLALGAVNFSIANKEKLLTEGRIVYLELAPVDPRSLMQGDYMALNFRVARDAQDQVAPTARASLDRALQTADGYVMVKLDERSVGVFQRLDDGQPLGADEIRLRYRVRNGVMKFATNAFFFQEGRAHDYSRARFGQLRVAPDGEVLLQAMRDEQMNLLGSQNQDQVKN